MVLSISGFLAGRQSHAEIIDGYQEFAQPFSITVSGIDTVYSDSIYTGGFGYLSFDIVGTQTNDSVAIDSIVILVSNSQENKARTGRWIRGKDRNGSIAWAKIATWTLLTYTAGTRQFYSIGVPPRKWITLVAYASSADNGTDAVISGEVLLTN